MVFAQLLFPCLVFLINFTWSDRGICLKRHTILNIGRYIAKVLAVIQCPVVKSNICHLIRYLYGNFPPCPVTKSHYNPISMHNKSAINKIAVAFRGRRNVVICGIYVYRCRTKPRTNKCVHLSLNEFCVLKDTTTFKEIIHQIQTSFI